VEHSLVRCAYLLFRTQRRWFSQSRLLSESLYPFHGDSASSGELTSLRPALLLPINYSPSLQRAVERFFKKFFFLVFIPVTRKFLVLVPLSFSRQTEPRYGKDGSSHLFAYRPFVVPGSVVKTKTFRIIDLCGTKQSVCFLDSEFECGPGLCCVARMSLIRVKESPLCSRFPSLIFLSSRSDLPPHSCQFCAGTLPLFCQRKLPLH